MSAQVHGLDAGTTPGLERARKKLEGVAQGLDLACARTANRAADGGRTDAARLIAAHYNLKQRDIKQSIRVKKRASAKSPDAVLDSRSVRSVSLRKWSPTPQPGGRKPPVGLSARILKAKGSSTFPGSFWMPVGGGSYTVMRRSGGQKRKAKKGRSKGRMREPLLKVWGPTFMAQLRRPDVVARIKASVAERMRKEMPRQVKYLLQTGRPLP